MYTYDIIKDVIELTMRNVDVFLINLAVFFFGYLVFKSNKSSINEAKIATTPTISFSEPFHFKGESRFENITLDQVEENPSKQIMYGGFTIGEIEISRDQYYASICYQKYNEAYEVVITNEKRQKFMFKIGSLFVILGTLVSLIKLEYTILVTMLTWVLFISVGCLLMFVFIKISRIIYKIKEKPEQPQFTRKF